MSQWDNHRDAERAPTAGHRGRDRGGSASSFQVTPKRTKSTSTKLAVPRPVNLPSLRREVSSCASNVSAAAGSTAQGRQRTSAVQGEGRNERSLLEKANWVERGGALPAPPRNQGLSTHDFPILAAPPARGSSVRQQSHLGDIGAQSGVWDEDERSTAEHFAERCHEQRPHGSHNGLSSHEFEADRKTRKPKPSTGLYSSFHARPHEDWVGTSSGVIIAGAGLRSSTDYYRVFDSEDEDALRPGVVPATPAPAQFAPPAAGLVVQDVEREAFNAELARVAAEMAQERRRKNVSPQCAMPGPPLELGSRLLDPPSALDGQGRWSNGVLCSGSDSWPRFEGRPADAQYHPVQRAKDSTVSCGATGLQSCGSDSSPVWDPWGGLKPAVQRTPPSSAPPTRQMAGDSAPSMSPPTDSSGVSPDGEGEVQQRGVARQAGSQVAQASEGLTNTGVQATVPAPLAISRRSEPSAQSAASMLGNGFPSTLDWGTSLVDGVRGLQLDDHEFDLLSKLPADLALDVADSNDIHAPTPPFASGLFTSARGSAMWQPIPSQAATSSSSFYSAPLQLGSLVGAYGQMPRLGSPQWSSPLALNPPR